eukprot:CFRG8231T1
MRVVQVAPESVEETRSFKSVKELAQFVDEGLEHKTHVVRQITNKKSEEVLNDTDQIVSVSPWLGVIPDGFPQEIGNDILQKRLEPCDIPSEGVQTVQSMLCEEVNFNLLIQPTTRKVFSYNRTKGSVTVTQPDEKGWVFLPWPMHTYVHWITLFAAASEPQFGLDNLDCLAGHVRLISNEEDWDEVNIMVIANRLGASIPMIHESRDEIE